MARNKRTGERRAASGKWAVYVRVNGTLITGTLEASATPAERDAWKETQRTAHQAVAPEAGSFAADLAEYAGRIGAMPSIKQRLAHLELWAQALGRDRPRGSITAKEIDAVLQDWLAAGLAPNTVRKRRTALQSFFVKMDRGTARVNPVKASANPKPPKVEARGLDYATLERALAAMPDQRDTKKGFPARPNLSKLRARVIAYTGFPPGILQTIRPIDLDLAHARVRITARKKGGGVEARTIDLNADAVAAFTDFAAADAFGGFAIESLNRAFKRGCKRAGLPWGTVHLYDARHSFLSQVYRVTRDLATVARLGLHAPGSPVTARYAMGANEEVDRAAAVAFSAALAAQRTAPPVPDTAPQLIEKVDRRSKVQSPRKLRAVV